MPRKLGLVHQQIATPRLGLHLDPAPTEVPKAVDWHKNLDFSDPLGNDIHSDCVEVAAFRNIQIRRFNAWGDLLKPTTKMCLDLYSKWSDYPKTDDGTLAQVANDDWTSQGVPYGDQYIDVPIIASCSPKSIIYIKSAIWHFGGIIIDWALPLAAQSETEWKPLPNTTDPNNIMGGWGQHRVTCGRYDTTGVYMPSWGELILADWDFLATYGLAIRVPISRAWMETTGTTPPGFDYAMLERSYKNILNA